MPRASIAETTLTQQIKRLRADIEVLLREREIINARITNTKSIIDAIEIEVSRLEAARLKTSKDRKP